MKEPTDLLIRVSVALLMCGIAPAHAQVLHASGPLPTFEVVSIKPFQPAPLPPAPPGEQIIHQETMEIAPKPMRRAITDHVHFVMSPQSLVASAYNLPISKEYRVANAPAWAHSQLYEIDARIDEAGFAALQKLPPEQQVQQMALMEQALLADRFHLKAHFETRMATAHALVVGKRGPKLGAANPAEKAMIAKLNDRMTVQNSTLEEWIDSPFLGSREIVDETGLTGRYDFTLTYSDRVSADGAADGPPPLPIAIQEQLGLKLEPTKAPLEYIVIDHIEAPAPN